MVGGFVAATVVTLLQYLRQRDRRLLLLATMFACQAQALAREWYDGWKDVYQAAVCAAGLFLLLAMSKHPPHPTRLPAPSPAAEPPAPPPSSGERQPEARSETPPNA